MNQRHKTNKQQKSESDQQIHVHKQGKAQFQNNIEPNLIPC